MISIYGIWAFTTLHSWYLIKYKKKSYCAKKMTIYVYFYNK